ncbi:abscisic acid and environmental stress-inducible protein-like isoform X2 [Nymphaea colorata]|nr:abscisic acid and environmental stress-inducible protein-like isoform X2 [Nymphaea colorata]
MALRRISLLVIFAAFLLFSQVLARELEEKPVADKRDALSQTQMDEFNDEKYGGYGGGGYGRGGYGYGRGGYGGYGHGGGYGYGHGRGCYYRCGYRCCSAEEYAEFVQGGN